MRETTRINKGVIIEGGVEPWQIFQQNAQGTADIHIWGSCYRVHQDFELPMQFHQIEQGNVTVKARIALESSSESVCPWTVCKVENNATWEITFEKVPAGGLYRIETYMEYEGWDGLSSTRGDMIHNIGVGDVFVVAGQSNAAGRAKNPVEDAPELGISVLRTNGRWDLATHPLADTTDAVHVGNFENHNPGHTPWIHFAKLLKRELGYPIGIVMTAYGGAPLRWWNKRENGALTDNMLDLLGEKNLHPKAMLWYQGEAEGYENAGETYLQRFTDFVGDVRAALDQPEMPIITVQLNRCMNPSTPELDRQWGLVRQAQVDACRIPGVYVVPSSDVALYDFIHNCAQGNLVIGERCARCAFDRLYGKTMEWRAPQATRAVAVSADTVRVEFSRIYNWMNPYDLAAELLPFHEEDEEGLQNPTAYETGADSLTIHFARPFAANARIHGVWKMNPGPCTPCDCMRMPMLSFYGLPITEETT